MINMEQDMDLRKKEETHRNFGHDPETDNDIGRFTSLQDGHRDSVKSNQCTAFHEDDDDRFVWSTAEDSVCVLLQNTEPKAYRDCDTDVYCRDEDPY